MKKLLYVLNALLIFSCSSSDDSSSTSSSDFNPPTWIQGTWIQEGTTQGQGVTFKFSSHDFCTSTFNVEQCYQGVIDLYRKGGANSSVEETTTNSSYSAKISYAGGQSVTYSFTKESNTKIECTSLYGAKFIKQ